MRPPESCTPATVVLPINYITPAMLPVVDPKLNVPNALNIQNSRFVLRCSDIVGAGPIGQDLVIEAGSTGRSFFWTDVPDITRVQLDYIAGLATEVLDRIVALNDIGTNARLSSDQAVFVEDAIAVLQEDIAAEVYASATSAIVCVWKSAAQIANCPSPGHLFTNESIEGDLAGSVNPVNLPAGFAESTISQADADTQALLEATSRLRCLFGNDALVLTCQDVGFVDPVPTDDPNGLPATVDGRYRIGSVAVGANQYFSSVSKNDANFLAKQVAAASLVCFYLNTKRTVSCANDAAFPDAYVDPVNYTAQLPGNPVTVDAGTFVADAVGSSQADADVAATQAGMGLLVCEFRNTAQTVNCPSMTVDGQVINPATTTQITVPAGEFTGSTQEEADELARESALLQLNCQYCNAYIPPSCYPPSYTPAPGKAIPIEDVNSSWSPDVVLGLAAGTVCSPDVIEAQIIAATVANKPVPVLQLVTGCTYVNDEMWFGCLKELPAGTPPLPPGGYHHPVYQDTALPALFAGLSFAQQLSADVTPKATGSAPYIVMPAGSQSVNSRDVPARVDAKVYANQMAALYGLSLLNCFFATPEMTLDCNTAYNGEFKQEDVATGEGQRTSVLMKAGAGTSYVSFAAAFEDAQQLAQGILDCYYESPPLHVRCWTGQSTSPSSRPELITSDGGIYVYGDGKVRLTTNTDGTITFSDIDLLPYQLGSVGLPLLLAKGSETSLVSPADALAKALTTAISLLDCTSQALVALLPVCSEKMNIKCGGKVEVNGASPFAEGTGDQVPDTWRYVDGVLYIGDGHNYVMSPAAPGFPSTRHDLGCSTDPVGGCTGTGLVLPVCFEQGRTQYEANLRAYLSGRSMLSCAGSPVTPPGSGASDGSNGSDGANGSDAPQTGCEGSCLAIYS